MKRDLELEATIIEKFVAVESRVEVFQYVIIPCWEVALELDPRSPNHPVDDEAKQLVVGMVETKLRKKRRPFAERKLIYDYHLLVCIEIIESAYEDDDY